MADIKFKYTDNNGVVHEDDTQYQCGYETLIYVDNPANEIIQIRDVDPCDSDFGQTIYPDDNKHTFEKNHKYLITIKDLDGKVTVEETRVYEVGHGAHENVTGICESNKCKVKLVMMRVCDYSNLITEMQNGNDSSKTWTAPEDCWLFGGCAGSSRNHGTLSINGNEVVYSGDGGASSWTDRSFSLFVLKGSVIHMRDSVYFKAFGCM